MWQNARNNQELSASIKSQATAYQYKGALRRYLAYRHQDSLTELLSQTNAKINRIGHKFIVIDPNNANGSEKKFEVSRRHAAKVYAELKNGNNVLEIYRSGSGMRTDYIVKPIRR